MSLTQLEHQGLKFLARYGSSDEKTFQEVIQKNSYERKFFKIEPGETWIDLGGNVGAFTVLAASKGATVHTFEPDAFNCGMIKKNTELNGSKFTLHQAAIVHDDTKTATLNLWPEGQSWRNSIVRNKKNTMPVQVDCVNLFDFIKDLGPVNIKMDIEGSEIGILSNWPTSTNVKKLVFEWSFDVDPSTQTLRNAIEKLNADFQHVKVTSQIYKIEQWTFFPPATMVFCWKD
jgi:FkbM family methyltransferase